MSGLFAGTKWERPVTCERCGLARELCKCPRSATGKVLVPGQQQPRVRREKRGGGKVVTIITGLDSVATDLPDLLKQLKSKCAAGGTGWTAVAWFVLALVVRSNATLVTAGSEPVATAS